MALVYESFSGAKRRKGVKAAENDRRRYKCSVDLLFCGFECRLLLHFSDEIACLFLAHFLSHTVLSLSFSIPSLSISRMVVAWENIKVPKDFQNSIAHQFHTLQLVSAWPIHHFIYPLSFSHHSPPFPRSLASSLW